jgi:hypothetical protein
MIALSPLFLVLLAVVPLTAPALPLLIAASL